MSDRDETLGFPEDDRNAPPKPGMSGTTKLLLILGGIGGFCLLLCCGGFAFLGYKAKDMVTNDPVKVRAATTEIADLEVLPGFEPGTSMDMFGIMKFVVYAANKDEKAGMLMLGSFNSKFAGNAGNPEQERAQMRQQMEAQRHGGQDLKVLKSETKEFEVRGSKSEFEFMESEDRNTHAKFRQVMGTFPAKAGTGMLILILPEEKYDEDAVVKMIKSIH